MWRFVNRLLAAKKLVFQAGLTKPEIFLSAMFDFFPLSLSRLYLPGSFEKTPKQTFVEREIDLRQFITIWGKGAGGELAPSMPNRGPCLAIESVALDMFPRLGRRPGFDSQTPREFLSRNFLKNQLGFNDGPALQWKVHKMAYYSH